MTEKDIILLRLEVLRLCYSTYSHDIADIIKRAKIAESYVLGGNHSPKKVEAPEKDKASQKK